MSQVRRLAGARARAISIRHNDRVHSYIGKCETTFTWDALSLFLSMNSIVCARARARERFTTLFRSIPLPLAVVRDHTLR